jgi:tRNA modification GTPase
MIKQSYTPYKSSPILLNNNENLTEEDLELLEKIKNKNYIIVINKTDLNQKIESKKLDKDKIIYISALNNIGIDKLKNKIVIKHQFNSLIRFLVQNPH